MKKVTGFVSNRKTRSHGSGKTFPGKKHNSAGDRRIFRLCSFSEKPSRTEAGGDGFFAASAAKINAKLAFSLFVAFDLLNGNEVPSTGLGVGSLYVCRVTLSVAGFIEFNVTGNTVVLNAPKSFVDSLRTAEPAP